LDLNGAGLETLLEEGDAAEGDESGEDEDVEIAVSAGEGGEVTVKRIEKVIQQCLRRSLQ
jgi:hypothetical protein